MGGVIEGVLFDFYFTLADPEAEEACGAARELLPEGFDYDALWSTWRGLRAPDVARALNGEIPEFRTFGSRWDEHGGAVLRAASLSGEMNLWRRCREASHSYARLYDDVRPTLRKLKEMGLKVGVLSDADNTWLAESISRSGLEFDVVVSSEDLACYKPHESVFRAACELLGAPVGSIVYVGDNPRLDVVGARNAGLTAVWLNRREVTYPEDLDRPHHTISSLTHLPRVLTDRTASPD